MRLCARWGPPPLLWPNGWMHQDATRYGRRPQPRGLCVRWGPSPPPQKGGGAPKFLAHVYRGQTARWIKMGLGMDVGLGPVHIVLDGDIASLFKKGQSPPQFSADLYCGQTAGCIKMPLGTEVGLGLRNIVFDVDPAIPRKKGHTHPHPILAHVYCGQMAGWMKTPLGTEVDRGQGHMCIRRGPSSRERAQQPPSFRPMSIVATVAHLSIC